MKIIKFSAEWCNQCKAAKRIVEKVLNEPEYKDIELVEYDVDDDDDKVQDLIESCSITQLPTFLFVKDNDIVGQHVGLLAYPKLKALIDNYK